MRRRAPCSQVCLSASAAGTRTARRRGESFIHWRVVILQQVPAFQIGLDESWAQGRNEVDGRKECEDGESDGDIERR
jgi:hypothetical protein